MKHIPKSQSKKHTNGPGCTVFEYGGDEEIDGAVAVINGRYPQHDYVLNERSREMVYVISGKGILGTKTETTPLQPGDVVLVPDGEAYYFEGQDLHMFLACTPPFKPDQHLEIK